jgi:PII-like signaling protein
MVLNNKTGKSKMYLNSKAVMKEYGISHATLFRCLGGYKSRKYDKDFKFIRIGIPVDRPIES